MSAIDVVDSEQTGVMKLRRKQKWVSSSAGVSLILASWVALHSACHPIYIVKRGRLQLDSWPYPRLYRSTSQFIVHNKLTKHILRWIQLRSVWVYVSARILHLYGCIMEASRIG